MVDAPTPRPDPLPFGTRMLGNLVQAPLFFAATAFFGTLSLTASLFERDGKLQHQIARIWAATSMQIALSPVTIIGEEKLRVHRAAVYAANHLSYMDTPVLFSAIPFQFRILARHSLWKVPFIGWHLNRSGQIAVNTESPSISSLSGGVKALKAGMPLIVFPEGGRSRDGRLSTFMSGPAYMAIRAQVPLIPLAIVGTYELLPMHTRHFFPQSIKLVVGDPLDTSNCTIRQVEELTERLKEAITRLYSAHAERIPASSGGVDLDTANGRARQS
ncbi:1-acyl-sn-glycerol-3-phosphate acyltransferase [Acidisarcina polymorpha]|uniref:1-acyl-sn-glycerol-3-phosphate acyltransferase n=1 Tax=Acidisarcina polymorpha TaxID=2211140 RepID=A0A2Z5FXT2_9BACT|nr:lysophospholipid acyltransferase family protein [Acidisarcina polymorpha]AXC11612.1 1-acyl-sn-glycerol-3-phosphate acyltransferase [Acidisarcina polymorpha]